MAAAVSSEFAALCRAQGKLLRDMLGLRSMVIYLAEVDDPQAGPTLVPLLAYPEAALAEAEGLGTGAELGAGLPLPAAEDGAGVGGEKPSPLPAVGTAAGHQLVLPLAHDGVVLGVMVSYRDGCPWSSPDQSQAEAVAHTIAAGYVLDQRRQWLQQQLQQQQQFQQQQSDTFHDLLHQFRNPLTALRTFGKLLLKRLPTDDPNYRTASGMVRESERLQDLAQYFDAAVAQGDAAFATQGRRPVPGRQLPGDNAPPRALPSGEQMEVAPASHLGRDLHMQPTAVVEVLTHLLLSAEGLAQERGIRLVSSLPTDLPAVAVDGLALREVLSNLVDNALKYSPAGATVWVTAGLFRTVEGGVLQGVAVGDTGVGIPAADQPRIFERHFRGVQEEGTIGGTGLGLAIAHDLVQAMGGQMDVCSPAAESQLVPAAAQGQGPGTVMLVWLPQVDPACPPRNSLGT